MLLTGEELRQFQVQRVTGGNPISPAERAAVDYKEAAKRRLDEAYAQDQRGRDACLTPDGEIPTTSLERALGKPLSLEGFTKRLKLVNPRLMVERSKKHTRLAGIYIQDNLSNLDDPDPYYRGVRYLGIAMEAGVSPEFTVRHARLEDFYDAETQSIKKRQVPTGELTIGWRVPLARLIRIRMATPEACDRVFGLPSRDSKNWWMLTT